jgi:Ctr copper transporter family
MKPISSALLILFSSLVVLAHEGHDHGAPTVPPPPTVATSTAPTLSVAAGPPANPFCMGASSMNHMGFSMPWEGACNVFLFGELVLDSPTKYAFGVIGTFLLGWTVELLNWNLHNVVLMIQNKPARVAAGFFNLVALFSIAYALMLLAMTYQVFIFIAIVLGLTTGRAIVEQCLGRSASLSTSVKF